MPEAAVETPIEEVAAEAVVAEPTSPVNADGTFAENWTASLPEDLRGDKTLGQLKDLPSAMRSLVENKALVGKKSTPVVPNEKSTPAEWEAFNKLIGRPDKPDAYKLDAPKGMEEFLPSDTIKAWQGVFHAAGLRPAQVDAIFKKYTGDMAAGMALHAAETDTQRMGLEKELRTIWPGKQYDENLSLANRVIADFCPDDKDKGELLAALGNSKAAAIFLSKLGAQFMEDGIINTDAENAAAGGIDDAIRQLRATPGYVDGTLERKNPAEHKRIAEELASLYRKKYPEVVGR